MSLAETASESAPFFSEDSEGEEPGGSAGRRPPEEEPPSGVSSVRALLTVLILCYINLLNYMDRFTVAGRGRATGSPRPITAQDADFNSLECSLMKVTKK